MKALSYKRKLGRAEAASLNSAPVAAPRQCWDRVQPSKSCFYIKVPSMTKHYFDTKFESWAPVHKEAEWGNNLGARGSPQRHKVEVGSPLIRVCMIFFLDNLKKKQSE